MSRSIRIEFPNALYHVTSRGDRREDIFDDDDDRHAFLKTLGDVVGQFNWLCYAWCLMDNHYHLLIQTPDGNLSKGMRQLNGVYTQLSNRRRPRLRRSKSGLPAATPRSCRRMQPAPTRTS